MYVQDDDQVAEVYSAELRHEFEVTRMRSGREVLRWLGQIQDEGDLPSLIMLDYDLPDMTGGRLVDMIRGDDRYAHIMLVMLSNHDAAGAEEVKIRLGAIRWLLKAALSPSQVSRRLGEALKKRGQTA